MPEETYVILRDNAPIAKGEPFPDPFRQLGYEYGTRTFGDEYAPAHLIEEPLIEVETLDKRGVAEFIADPGVRAIAPTMPMTLIAPTIREEATAVEDAGSAWGVEVTRADDSPYTGAGIKVAILDTGIDAEHEAFQGVPLFQEDFTGTGHGDGNGHGTHCAGTVFGQTVKGFRFGIAQGIQQALIGKVLNAQGSGSTAQIYQGIIWALEKGAHVISLSLGLDFPGMAKNLAKQGYPVDLATSRALEAYRANLRFFDQLSELIRARGALFQSTLVVAAAGNESKRQISPNYEIAVSPPAAADGFISVGAIESSGSPHQKLTVANFSNTGPGLSAPGVGIYSAKNGGGYVVSSGTSMAAPHVAAIAALWAEKLSSSRNPISRERWVACLLQEADRSRFAPGVQMSDVGAGLVQAPLV